MDSFNPLLFSTLHGNGSVGNVDEHSVEHPVDLNEKEHVHQAEVSSFQVPEDNDSEEQVQKPPSGDLVGQVQQEDPPEEVIMEEGVTGGQVHDDPGDEEDDGDDQRVNEIVGSCVGGGY
jgi:hypothetical protein